MATLLWRLFYCLAILNAVLCSKGKFTSMTNLEKLFTMESEIISLADVLIREEHFAHQGEENPHDLSNITRVVSEAKDLHRNITSITEYLSHPLNVLHMTERLQKRWPNTLKAFWESEPCQKWNLPEFRSRIANIWNNLPNYDDLKTVALSIANIIYTEKLDVKDLYTGVIWGQRSLQSVTMTDLWQMTLAAYNAGQYLFTTQIVERLLEVCKTSPEATECGLKLYKMAANSYYKLDRLSKAVEMSKKVLQKDHEDSVEKRNLKFYESRLKSGSGSAISYGATNIRYFDTCRGDRRKSAAERSRLSCKLLPTKQMFVFEKVEYHNNKPLVIEFHETFSRNSLKMMQNSAARSYLTKATKDGYRGPTFTYLPYKTSLYDEFSNRFVNLSVPLIRPFNVGTVEVRQTGMEGMYVRAKDRQTLRTRGGHVGSYFTFLNDGYHGGDFVFPQYKLKITPVMGNTILFFATKSTLSICPVSYGAQWVAVQSVYEEEDRTFCRQHDRDLWTEKSSN